VKLTSLKLICLLSALCGVASTSHAGLLPTGVTTFSEISGTTRWQYAIVLPTDSQLRNGDYFTIYDFDGYVAGSEITPTDWSFSAQLVGPTPPKLLPTDDPVIYNLTWKYNGPTIDAGQVGLGNFMASSLYSNSKLGFFTAQTHRFSDGKLDTNVTRTDVPSPSGTSNVPEPGTLALAALGLPLLGLARLRRKNSAVVA
jgi:hypothetical protein